MSAHDQKEFATAQAQAALRGITLRRVTQDGTTFYSVSRWNMGRTVATLAEAQALIRRIVGDAR